MMKALYIILDARLTKSQCIPQASHALAEYMGDYG